MLNFRRILCFLAISVAFTGGSARAQVLSNSSLTGKYFIRHVQFTTDANNNVTDARSIVGTVSFTGSGQYTLNGQQVILTGAAASYTVSGTYSVSPAGTVSMTNPQRAALTINGRFGTEALVGSSTEAEDNTFDMLVAIPAPTTANLTAASLKTTFFGTDFELPGASSGQVRVSRASLAFDGAGNVPAMTATGHAAGVNSGGVLNQAVTGAIYSVSADGSGTLTIPAALPPVLGNGVRTLAVSQSGNVILASTPGAHDLFIGVKSLPGTLNNASFTGRSWVTGLRIDSSGSSESYTGSGTVINVDTAEVTSHRTHETGAAAFDVTASSVFTIAADGTGSAGPTRIALGANGTYVGANYALPLDPTGYEIVFGIPIPAVTGSGVFVNPQGVVNAASNAPAGNPISPGEFIAIYGSGLASQTLTSVPPYPNTVGGVGVTINGTPAPVYLVSPGQINCLVPFGATGATATIVVSNNGALSNTVVVPLAKTSPGIFSNDTSGTGDGAIVHASDGVTLVSAANPAKRGETLVMYLTGLGAVQTAVPDGKAPNAADLVTTQIQIYVGGIPVTAVLYAGLNPSYPGLYQINFAVPAGILFSGEVPIAIQTPEAFHDQLNLFIQ